MVVTLPNVRYELIGGWFEYPVYVQDAPTPAQAECASEPFIWANIHVVAWLARQVNGFTHTDPSTIWWLSHGDLVDVAIYPNRGRSSIDNDRVLSFLTGCEM